MSANRNDYSDNLEEILGFINDYENSQLETCIDPNAYISIKSLTEETRFNAIQEILTSGNTLLITNLSIENCLFFEEYKKKINLKHPGVQVPGVELSEAEEESKKRPYDHEKSFLDFLNRPKKPRTSKSVQPKLHENNLEPSPNINVTGEIVDANPVIKFMYLGWCYEFARQNYSLKIMRRRDDVVENYLIPACVDQAKREIEFKNNPESSEIVTLLIQKNKKLMNTIGIVSSKSKNVKVPHIMISAAYHMFLRMPADEVSKIMENVNQENENKTSNKSNLTTHSLFTPRANEEIMYAVSNRTNCILQLYKVDNDVWIRNIVGGEIHSNYKLPSPIEEKGNMMMIIYDKDLGEFIRAATKNRNNGLGSVGLWSSAASRIIGENCRVSLSSEYFEKILKIDLETYRQNLKNLKPTTVPTML